MGLRCLLGHDFTEPVPEREREDRGTEVVITVREVKTCRRCGERRVVTENTEVTSVGSLRDAAAGGAEDVHGDPPDASPGTELSPESGTTADPDPDPGPGLSHGSDVTDAAADISEPAGGGEGSEPIGDASDRVDTEEPPDPATEDAEIIDAGPDTDNGDGDADEPADGGATSLDSKSGSESGGEPDPDAAPEAGATDTDDGPVAADDDGVIIDGTAGSDRSDGEWPEGVEADPPSDHDPWPDHGDAPDEGVEATPSDGATDVPFGGGLTPEPGAAGGGSGPGTDGTGPAMEGNDPAGGDGSAGADPVEEGAEDPGTGITRPEADAAADDATGPGGSDEVEYYCPECGMSRPVGGSSMRSGDICPECRRGYVAERPL